MGRLCNVHVDAFCVGKDAFTGNPAAVVVFEEGDGAFPPSSWMQALAAENALSETAFISARKDGSFSLKWFTPGTEVDLCGHATLAAAHVLFEKGLVEGGQVVLLHTMSGPLTAARTPSGWLELDFPAEPPCHVSAEEAASLLPLLLPALGVGDAVPVGELALVLGGRPTRGVSDEEGGGAEDRQPSHQPHTVSFLGRNRHDVYVELSASAFIALPPVPDMAALGRVAARGVVVTAMGPASRSGDSEGVGGEEEEGARPDFVSRWFGPRVGVPEDPVTGSAHCGLAPYWTGKLLAEGGGLRGGGGGGLPWLAARQASARGGDLRVRLVRSAGEGGDRVLLQGHAVTVVDAWLAPAAHPPGQGGQPA